VVDQLAALKVPYLEMLRSSKATRDAAQTLAAILNFYAHPSAKKNLLNAVLGIIGVKHGRKTMDEYSKEIRPIVNALDFPETLFSEPPADLQQVNAESGELSPSLSSTKPLPAWTAGSRRSCCQSIRPS
jgi:hypothetical protein